MFVDSASPELMDVAFGALLAIIGFIMAVGRRPFVEAKLFEGRLYARLFRIKHVVEPANDQNIVKSASIVYLIGGVVMMSFGFYIIIDFLWGSSL